MMVLGIIGFSLFGVGIALVATFAVKHFGGDNQAQATDDMLPPHTLGRPANPWSPDRTPSRWADHDTPRRGGDGRA